MGEPVSPQPRRVTKPRWLDVRLVLGIVLVLASVVVGAKVVSSASRTFAEVTAARDLAAGTVLTADDLRLTQVQLSGNTRGAYLTATEKAVGKRLDRPVIRGELIPSASVRAVAAQTTLTVPLPSGTAPDLHAGQRVDVWASTPSCAPVKLLADVTVQAVHRDDGGSFSADAGGGAGQDVVIDVAPAVADRVIQALAIEDVKLRAGVVAGPRATPPDAPDLSGCSADAQPK